PGATGPVGQLTVTPAAANIGSVTTGSVRVTLPSFVIVNRYQISSPVSVRSLSLTSTTSETSLTREAAGSRSDSVVASSVTVSGGPWGGTPVARTSLSMLPRSTSACVAV